MQKEVSLARRELKNIRQEVLKLGAKQKQESEAIKLAISKQDFRYEKEETVKNKNENGFNMVPIGLISSCFKNKNGIPRQPSLCQTSKARLEINKTSFTNPEHSVIGLNEFTHIWILFVFHKNKESSMKAKIHPPRLNGTSVGVFSTRSPHRPCAIGLSLTKLEKIIGNTIFLSGIDILDGTPVLDIKPYIPSYDIPPLYRNIRQYSNETCFPLQDFTDSLDPGTTATESTKIIKEKADFCSKSNDSTDKACKNNVFETDTTTDSASKLLKEPSNPLQVLFTERATKDIVNFHAPSCDTNCEYCLNFIDSSSAAKQAITEILQNDPRSVYRKKKCSDKLYFFEIDKLHVTCWFDDRIAEVLRVKPINGCLTKSTPS